MTAPTHGDRRRHRVPDERPSPPRSAELVEAQVASKLTAQDPTLWGPDAESEAAIRLSWVSLAESSRPLVARIDRAACGSAGRGV